MSQMVSHFSIQKAASWTLTCGPSSLSRSASVGGLPSVNVPAGIGTMSKEMLLPGIVSL